jgi:hypothetical protein
MNRRLFAQVKNVKSMKRSWSSFYRPLQMTSPFSRSFGSPTGIALIGTPITAWYMSQINQEETQREAPLTITYPVEPFEVSSLRLLLRMLYLGLIMTPALVLFPVWILYEYILKSDALRDTMIRLVCWTLENMGPTFIKVRFWFLNH